MESGATARSPRRRSRGRTKAPTTTPCRRRAFVFGSRGGRSHRASRSRGHPNDPVLRLTSIRTSPNRQIRPAVSHTNRNWMGGFEPLNQPMLSGAITHARTPIGSAAAAQTAGIFLNEYSWMPSSRSASASRRSAGRVRETGAIGGAVVVCADMGCHLLLGRSYRARWRELRHLYATVAGCWSCRYRSGGVGAGWLRAPR